MSLLLRVIGIAVAAGLAGVGAAAVFVPTPEAESIEARRNRGATAAFAPLPAVNLQTLSLILDMSPFANDRSAFDRATASAPPPPPVEVKLTGVFRLGKELRASLMINGQSIVGNRPIAPALLCRTICDRARGSGDVLSDVLKDVIRQGSAIRQPACGQVRRPWASSSREEDRRAG